jgi:Fe-S-cluster containining protein
LTDEDILNIRGYAQSDSCVTADKRIRLIRDPGGEGFFCPFLRIEDNTCVLYAVRPFECLLYPFVINRRDGRIFLAVDANCPFAEEMVRVSGKGAGGGWENYIAYLEDLLNKEPQCGLLKRNPHIIQTYKDVLDLRELFR